MTLSSLLFSAVKEYSALATVHPDELVLVVDLGEDEHHITTMAAQTEKLNLNNNLSKHTDYNLLQCTVLVEI